MPGGFLQPSMETGYHNSDNFSSNEELRWRLKRRVVTTSLTVTSSLLDAHKRNASFTAEKKRKAAAGIRCEQGEGKSEIQDAKLRWKNCRSLGVSPLSGGEESGPHCREILRWSGFLGHSL